MPNLIVERGNDKGAIIELGRENRTYVVGRASECDLALDDTFCSRRHFEVHCDNGWYYLQDLGSHNGTRHNGRSLKAAGCTGTMAGCASPM